MIDGIPADWRTALAPAIGTASFRQLVDFVDAERARTDTSIYPPESDVFAALRLTPLASIRAVILGQDPYHSVGQAHMLGTGRLDQAFGEDGALAVGDHPARDVAGDDVEDHVQLVVPPLVPDRAAWCDYSSNQWDPSTSTAGWQ